MNRLRCVALLLIVAVCSLGDADVGYYPGLPAIAQFGLPTPPMQKAPWTPPERGPGEVFAGAVAAIFKDGLPDPRGCEYREFKVPVLKTRGNVQLVETHGWLLPPSVGAAGFAICWDGLIYPVMDVGEKADLDADVAAALKTEGQWRKEHEGKHPGSKFSLLWNASLADRATDAQMLVPLKACILLRIGRADLARKVWDVAADDYNLSLGVHEGDPFMVFATDWAWAKYKRAIVCKSRGLTIMALADLSGLQGLRQQLVDAAAERGYPREWAGSLLEFLSEAPELLADAQRCTGVDELIHNLQEVRLEPHSIPVHFDFSDSQTMLQLVLLGEPAVDPLLDAMETDSRLSRTPVYGRPSNRSWGLMPVHDLEWTAATAILGDPPAPDLAHLRAWWQANEDRPFVERLYATLADDDAGRSMWLWAARRMVQPADEPVEPLDLLSAWRTESELTSPPRWMGEPLRDGRQPAASELMAHRALAISHMGRPGTEQYWRMQDATRMGVRLARWDPQAAGETLRTIAASWQGLLAAGGENSSLRLDVASSLADLTLARMHVDDAAALADYAKWVESGYTDDTRPLWLAPQDPAVLKAAGHLLEHLRAPDDADRFSGQLAPASPMLAVEPFRHCVLQELANVEAIGSVHVSQDNSVVPDFRGWMGPWPKDRPAPGTSASVRVCDSFAWDLSRLPGFPEFDPFAPQTERDRAVAECIHILTADGPRFSEAVDRRAYWNLWLRGNGRYERPYSDAIFNPERVLQPAHVSP